MPEATGVKRWSEVLTLWIRQMRNWHLGFG
jgi:hypothetical protein